MLVSHSFKKIQKRSILTEKTRFILNNKKKETSVDANVYLNEIEKQRERERKGIEIER